jgi:low temperature requirement protein LtrA
MLFAAIWWVWMYTAWATNWLNPQERPVRILLLILMLGGLALSLSLPTAFSTHGLMFALSYIGVQQARNGFMLWSTKHHDAGNFKNMTRIGLWFCASALFWLAGAFAWRTPLWGAALCIDLAGPACYYFVPGLGRSLTTDWAIDSFHMAERCGNFIMIALGESITVAGGSLYAMRWGPVELAAFVPAFLGIICLWWIYFDRAAEFGAETFAKAPDTGRIARAAYTYVHALLVAGIIVTAAADGLVLSNPLEPAGVWPACLVLGGPALFLLGSIAFRQALARRRPRSHLYGLAFLAVLAPLAAGLPLLALAGASALVLFLVVILSEILPLPARS